MMALKFTVILFGIALLFASEATADDCCMSPWGTLISDGEGEKSGIDTGWVGRWRLDALVIGPAGGSQVLAPIVGATLTINSDGAFLMDYQDAEVPDQTMSIIPWAGTGGLLTGNPGAGVPAEFQPISCYETAVFSGYVTGQLFAPYDMNLDALNDNQEVTGAATALPSMEVSLDWQNSIKPEITCTGATAQVRTQAGPPLGFAQPHETNNGTVVSYSYSMNSSLTIMVIEGGPDLPLQYIFSGI